MKKGCLLISLLTLCFIASSQTNLEDSLKRELAKAISPGDKISRLRDLSGFYMSTNPPLADQFGRRMIEIADSTRDRALMCRAYLHNAERYYNFSVQQQNLSKAIDFSQKALDLSRENNLPEYSAWAYTYLARGYRVNGEGDKALNFNNLAISMANDVDNDSLKVGVYNSMGNTYLGRNEKLLAFRNYLQALNVAEKSGKYELLVDCYKRMSGFYIELENYERAKDFEFKRLELYRAHNKPFDVMSTYSSIGTIYTIAKQYEDAERYYEKAYALADSLKFDVYKYTCYINIVNLYLSSKQFEKGLAYFNAHKEIREFLTKAGMTYLIDQAYGSIYTFAGKLDSAGLYFKRVAPDFEARASRINKYYFYTQYAFYYRMINQYDSSIFYWMKAKTVGEQLGSLDIQQVAAQNLDSLYQFKKDYQNAFAYNALYYRIKDSVQKMAKEKDLMTLEIDNENRRKERLAKQEEEELRRSHNLQYLGITVAIAAIFVMLVMAGAFSVSKATIRVLGFFAFIFLFEFIILLADNQIHDWTHGEPWKVLAIKIVLIAVLLPLHHWLEEKVIHYLSTKEVLKIRKKGLLGKWFKKKDADLPVSNM